MSNSVLAGNAEDICRPKWGNDVRMLKYCIRLQLSAKEAVDKWQDNDGDFEVLNRCEEKWTNEELAIDYSMVEKCINEQPEATKIQ